MARLIKKETYNKALVTIEKYFNQINNDLGCEENFKTDHLNPIRNYVNEIENKNKECPECNGSGLRFVSYFPSGGIYVNCECKFDLKY